MFGQCGIFVMFFYLFFLFVFFLFSKYVSEPRTYVFEENNMYIYIYGADVVKWSRALDIRLSDWCCSVSMV